MPDSIKTIATNRAAFHEYFVEEKFEAGISLAGTEVKSIRAGHVNLKDAYCEIENGQMKVLGLHITPYEKGNVFNKEPMRERVLLMHKHEIMRLFGNVKQKGLTLIPLSMYFKGKYVKVEIGLCRGKKLYDKRAVAAEKDAKRDMERSLRERNMGA